MANTGQRLFKWDINAEIDSYLDESSLSGAEPPTLVILLGGVAAGKTTRRKEHYSTGYVVVDAAEIFRRLTPGENFPFPDVFEEMMDLTGRLVADQAVEERRNIVTELIPSDLESSIELIDAMHAIGYVVSCEALVCHVEEAQRRNLARGEDNVSCYYAEPYQRRWLLEAARKVQCPVLADS